MGTEALQARVQDLLDGLVAPGDEVGLQVAACVDGRLVVDAWAGLADEATRRPVDGETLFTIMSTTKGFMATCLHLLAERGLVAYDAPIATYWPEFAANGKERATVRHALTHAAGVPHLPEDVTPELLCDWDAMCTYLAAEAPLYEPGTRSTYHGAPFGYIIGEIVRRVDGRPIAQFAQEELCAPLGIADFYLGIPDAVLPRVATLRDDPAQAAGIAALTGWARRIIPPQVISAALFNRPDIRRVALPFAGGITNARAIARHYALLARHGDLDGVRLLSPARVEEMRALQVFAPGAILDGKPHKGLGYMLYGEPDAQGRYAFGHDGAGGSLGLADPARRLSVGVTKTLLRADTTTADTIVAQIQAAIPVRA
jgi:CubicO group peptidase (beta-lactamase class C family)